MLPLKYPGLISPTVVQLLMAPFSGEYSLVAVNPPLPVLLTQFVLEIVTARKLFPVLEALLRHAGMGPMYVAETARLSIWIPSTPPPFPLLVNRTQL